MRFVKLELGGRDRTVRFGLKTIGDAIKHFNNDPVDLMDSLGRNRFHALPVLFYYGMKAHDEREGVLVNYTLLDVIDWLEEKGIIGEEMDQAVQAFNGSLYDNVPQIREVVDAMDPEKKRILIGT